MTLYPLQNGWKVLDIGASKGLWTLEATLAGCTVIACEPLTKYRESILKNGAAVVLPVAVSDIEDRITFTIGQDDRFSSIHAEWVREADATFGWDHTFELIDVPTVRLDQIIAVYGEFDFIKIDTEGHEPSVIRSLGEHRPERMSLEFHGGTNVLQSMHNSSYEALELLGAEYRYRFAVESRTWASDWLGITGAIGMLQDLSWGDVYCERVAR